MKLFATICFAWLLTIFAQPFAIAADDQARIAELNQYWAEVARSVKAGDFAAYQATCHKEGVLVSGVKKQTEPLSAALTRWEKEFTATKAGQLKAAVEFRFAQRLNDSTTAHETGIFHYTAVAADGKKIDEYIHFEGLLVKQDGKWKILMEYQKSKATVEEWKGLE